jgi:hypothetical protein
VAAVATRLDAPLDRVAVEDHGKHVEVLTRQERRRLPAVRLAGHELVVGPERNVDGVVGLVQVPEMGRVGAITVLIHALHQRDELVAAVIITVMIVTMIVIIVVVVTMPTVPIIIVVMPVVPVVIVVMSSLTMVVAPSVRLRQGRHHRQEEQRKARAGQTGQCLPA